MTLLERISYQIEKYDNVKQEKNVVVPPAVKYFQKIETHSRTMFCKVVYVSGLRFSGNAGLL